MEYFHNLILARGLEIIKDVLPTPMSNPICLVKDMFEGYENFFYVMKCNADVLVYFSICDFKKIVYSSISERNIWGICPKKRLVVRHYPETKIEMSEIVKDQNYFGSEIFHQNRNKKDNRRSNLRYGHQQIREMKKLPENFQNWMRQLKGIFELPDYCIYCIEDITGLEYFIIDLNHPILHLYRVNEEIGSTRETNISLIDKFLQIERGFVFLRLVAKNNVDLNTKKMRYYMYRECVMMCPFYQTNYKIMEMV